VINISSCINICGCAAWLWRTRQGPPAIGKGVTAAVKERFPEIREVELQGF
jgi:hypothetical protein